MARRARNGRFLPAVPASFKPRKRKAKAKRNPPARAAKRNPPRARAKRNPPGVAKLRQAIAPGSAALVGGLIASAGVALASRVLPDGARDVARVVVPALVGFAATQVAHKHASAVAAGAFGVAGLGLGNVIADAIVKPNPPLPEDWWIDNPPPALDLVESSVNDGFRDGITARLMAGG